MKYNITSQGPTSLHCPKCGYMCNFNAGQNVITCSSCNSELTLDKLSRNIESICFLLACTLASVSYFINIHYAIDATLLLIGISLYFYLPRKVYKKSYLEELIINT